jgi:WD40 repeat protein
MMNFSWRIVVLTVLVCSVPQRGAAEQQAAQAKFKHAQVCAADFSPDGKTLASAGEGGVVLWDLATGKEVRRLATQYRPAQVRFSSDGMLLAAADPEEVYLWRVTSGELRFRDKLGGSHEIHALGYNPRGDALTVFFNRGKMRSWDVTRRQEAPANWQLQCGGGRPNIEVSRDGQLLVSSQGSKVVRLTRMDGSELKLTSPTASPCRLPSLAISADSRTVAAAGQSVIVWEAATGKELAQYPVGYYRSPDSAALSADGSLLATLGTEGYPYDLNGGHAIVNQAGFFVRVRDAKTGRELRRLALPAVRYNGGEAVWGLKFSPDGKTLVGLRDDTIFLWDVSR